MSTSVALMNGISFLPDHRRPGSFSHMVRTPHLSAGIGIATVETGRASIHFRSKVAWPILCSNCVVEAIESVLHSGHSAFIFHHGQVRNVRGNLKTLTPLLLSPHSCKCCSSSVQLLLKCRSHHRSLRSPSMLIPCFRTPQNCLTG